MFILFKAQSGMCWDLQDQGGLPVQGFQGPMLHRCYRIFTGLLVMRLKCSLHGLIDLLRFFQRMTIICHDANYYGRINQKKTPDYIINLICHVQHIAI